MGITEFAISTNTGIQQNWNFTPRGISGFADSAKLEILELHHMEFLEWFLWTSLLLKTACFMLQIFHKETEQSKSLQFSKVRNSTKHKWFTYSVQDF